MDIEGLAPDWLLRWLTDGALATLSVAPSIIALTCYAWLCFWMLDTLLSAIDKLVVMRVLRSSLATGQALGNRGARLHFLLSRFPGWLLTAWVGLPMFSVVQLVLSKEPEAQQKLRSMASGFAWESDLLNRLPAVHFWQVPDGSAGGQLVVAGLAGAFLSYTYLYWSRGFDLVRRIRIIGDALVALVNRDGAPPPAVAEASARLDAAGWPSSAVRSGLWFLAMLNMRIIYKNDAYQRLTPRGYGLYRVAGQLGVASVLSAVHPVVAGLFVASGMKKASDLRATAKLYTKHFANLPEAFRSQLDFSGARP
jgi:hypothetical protein